MLKSNTTLFLDVQEMIHPFLHSMYACVYICIFHINVIYTLYIHNQSPPTSHLIVHPVTGSTIAVIYNYIQVNLFDLIMALRHRSNEAGNFPAGSFINVCFYY